MSCVAEVQGMGYVLRDERTTWPKRQSLSDFARRSCRPLTNIIISDYFDQLWPRFLELKQRVNDVVHSAQNELQQLYIKFLEYQKSLTTGTDFVR